MSTSPSRRWRRGDRTTLLSLPPLLLLATLSYGLLWAVTLPAGDWQLWLLAGWTVTFPLTFVRPVERAFMWRSWGLTRLSRQQERRLRPLWANVTATAGRKPDQFMLAVQQGDHINALAGGFHTVAVTSAALKHLPDEPLEAVLAHELGHHLGAHTVVSAAAAWLMLPVQAVNQVARAVHWLVVKVINITGQAGLIPVAVAGIVLTFVLRLLLRLLNLLVRAGQFALVTVGRAAETAADRVAVQLGYGPALKRLFQQMDRGDTRRWWRRLWDSHPPMGTRVRRIDRQLN